MVRLFFFVFCEKRAQRPMAPQRPMARGLAWLAIIIIC